MGHHSPPFSIFNSVSVFVSPFRLSTKPKERCLFFHVIFALESQKKTYHVYQNKNLSGFPFFSPSQNDLAVIQSVKQIWCNLLSKNFGSDCAKFSYFFPPIAFLLYAIYRSDLNRNSTTSPWSEINGTCLLFFFIAFLSQQPFTWKETPSFFRLEINQTFLFYFFPSRINLLFPSRLPFFFLFRSDPPDPTHQTYTTWNPGTRNHTRPTETIRSE